MRRWLRYVYFMRLFCDTWAVTVDDVRSRACEWEHNSGGGDAQSICDAQKNRVACYPASNCAGGVFYGIFLRDWLSNCPDLLVSEYDKMCGDFVESSSMSSATYALIVGGIVVGAILVATLGVWLMLRLTRHHRPSLSTQTLPPPTPIPVPLSSIYGNYSCDAALGPRGGWYMPQNNGWWGGGGGC